MINSHTLYQLSGFARDHRSLSYPSVNSVFLSLSKVKECQGNRPAPLGGESRLVSRPVNRPVRFPVGLREKIPNTAL